MTKLEQVTVEEIVSYPLIVSNQSDIDKSVFANYDYKVVATYNLLYTASRLVQAGLGIALCLDGIVDHPELVFLPVLTKVMKVTILSGKTDTIKPLQKSLLEEISATYEMEN
ncbi:MAG: hypothetical protein ACLT8V_08615 [Streptococcus salivarius]